MNNRNSKKVFMLIIYICMSIFGIYMTFFHKKDADEKPLNSNQIESEIEKETDMEMMIAGTETGIEIQELPDEENTSADETYTEGISTDIYFTNAAVIDQGNLPMSVHSSLEVAASKYLKRSDYKDVTELYVNEDSYTETEEKIAFSCFMDGYQEQLQIVYDISESRLLFAIANQGEK